MDWREPATLPLFGSSMVGTPTVLAGIASSVVRSAVSSGARASEIHRRAGLDPKALEHADHRISLAAYERLWLESAATANDPAFGIRVGLERGAASLGMLGYLAMSSRDLGQALERAARLFKLLNEAGTLRIE